MSVIDKKKLIGGSLLFICGFTIFLVSWQFGMFSPGPRCNFPFQICLNTSRGILSIEVGMWIGASAMIIGLILIAKAIVNTPKK